MKKIPDGEIDRDLVLKDEERRRKDGSLIYHDVIKAKVSSKCFILFTDRAWHPSWNIRNKHIKFERSSRDLLRIETRCEYETTVKCSLGHEHVVDKKETSFDWFTLPWEHVDSLIEWLQSGSWTEVQGDRAPWKRVMKEVDEFLVEIEKRDALLKPACQKLRVKIKNVMP